MKKLILPLMITFSVSAFAVDTSVDTSQTENTNTENSMSYKKAKDLKDTKAEKESKTKTVDDTHSSSHEISRVDQASIMMKIKNSEKGGEFPFSECQVFTHPKLTKDFGLSAKMEDGSFDTYFADLLSKAATYNSPITEVNADQDEVKDYINCVSYYGAIVAQSIKTQAYSIDITDKDIKKMFKSIQKDLANSDCVFDKSVDNIVCGAVNLKIAYKPSVEYANIPIYADNTFFGYSGSKKISDGNSVRNSKENQTSTEKMKSKSLTKDNSINVKEGTGEDQSAKTNFSPRSWLPFGK